MLGQPSPRGPAVVAAVRAAYACGSRPTPRATRCAGHPHARASRSAVRRPSPANTGEDHETASTPNLSRCTTATPRSARRTADANPSGCHARRAAAVTCPAAPRRRARRWHGRSWCGWPAPIGSGVARPDLGTRLCCHGFGGREASGRAGRGSTAKMEPHLLAVAGAWVDPPAVADHVDQTDAAPRPVLRT